MKFRALFMVFVFCTLFALPGKGCAEPPQNSEIRAAKGLTLEEAARLALAASLELKSARADRALREGAWRLGLRSYFPQIGFSLSEDDRLSLISSDSFLKSWTLSLDQLLWDGGKTGAERTLERAGLRLADDEIRRNESEIAETAIGAYRGLLVQRMSIAIRESALEALAEQQRILEKEFSLGMVSALDRTAGEITLRQAENETALLRLEAEEAERNFCQLIGMTKLPELVETIDTQRSAVSFSGETVKRAALSRNPELASKAHLLMRRQTELRLASLVWLPSIKANGNFTLSGQRYPLHRYSYSFGLTVQFSSPWFKASTGGTAGWEAPFDRTARVQNSFTPLPDPASGFSKKQAELALALEGESYREALKNTARAALLGTEKILLAEKRRLTALSDLELAGKKYRLTLTLADLGRITRVEHMEARIEYAEKEIKAAEAALTLLSSERELEKLLDLGPGALAEFCEHFGGK